MLLCPICGAENDDLAIVCTSCKAYVQAKVDTLDLFHTSWGLLESPLATMHRIAIAKHKNYTVFLTMFFGIAFAITVLWYGSYGRLLGGLGGVLAVATVGGPVLGAVTLVLMSVVLRVTSHLLGGHSTLRQTMAVAAYATLPIVWSLFLVFPVEVAIFGEYFFESNPPPIVINPVAYLGLLGIDIVAVFWSWILLVIAVRVAHRLTAFRAFCSSLSIPILAAVLAYGIRLVKLGG
jgi:hypothetical protein